MEENNKKKTIKKNNNNDKKKTIEIPFEYLGYGIIVFVFIVTLMFVIRFEKTKAIVENMEKQNESFVYDEVDPGFTYRPSLNI